MNSVSDESSSGVKLQLLSAVMKLFFKRPPECQEMLGRLLEHAIGKSSLHEEFWIILLPGMHGDVLFCADEEGDIDVHDRGMLYYRLLKKDVKEAERVVCGQIKTVTEKNTVIPRVKK